MKNERESGKSRRRLNEKNVQLFLELLDGWEGRLTWEGLIDAFERRVGVRITRQALDRHDQIKRAYQVRKDQIRGGDKKTVNLGSPELQVALDRCALLEVKIQRLEAQNDAFNEQFVRWLYNANLKGVKIGELDATLPIVDRQSTRKSH